MEGRRKGTEQLRGADGGRALCNCKHHQPRPQQGRWQVTVPVAVARHRMIRRVTSGPGCFLVLTMRTAFGGLCLRRRNRLRSSTGRIPTATWTSKVPPLLAVHAPAERMGLTTSHARTCKHVLVVLCACTGRQTYLLYMFDSICSASAAA